MNERVIAMQWAIHDNVMVVALGEAEPADSDWLAMLSALIDAPDVHRVLMVTDGAGPNARQRTAIASRMEKVEYKWAILSASPSASFIGQALGWFGIEARTFPLRKRPEALVFLDVPLDRHAALGRRAAELRAVLAGFSSFEDLCWKVHAVPDRAVERALTEPIATLARVVGGGRVRG